MWASDVLSWCVFCSYGKKLVAQWNFITIFYIYVISMHISTWAIKCHLVKGGIRQLQSKTNYFPQIINPQNLKKDTEWTSMYWIKLQWWNNVKKKKKGSKMFRISTFQRVADKPIRISGNNIPCYLCIVVSLRSSGAARFISMAVSMKGENRVGKPCWATTFLLDR